MAHEMQSAQNDSAPQGLQSALACERCKRRKIKCDRSLPACQTCTKTSSACSYPETAHKPGPKPGAPQRRKRKYVDANPVTNHLPTPSTRVQDQDFHGSPWSEQIVQPASQSDKLPPSEREGSSSRGPGLALSQLLHLSHEPLQTASALMSLGDHGDGRNGRAPAIVIQDVCKALGISNEIYEFLLRSYFENMTAFSLFHRPTFDAKISKIPSLQLQALLASMFSISARFIDVPQSGRAVPAGVPSHETFYEIGERMVTDTLRRCSDEVPPLCLLQALVLVTFQQLIKGVRGRAWRLVGECVRMAYELQLHLIDKAPSANNRNPPSPALDEEKRRVWWVIWEFDVFATAVRRLPTAINWKHNQNWLPIDDDIWFANACARSCPLNPDAAMAWKDLQATGNKSSKAWFIVVNALMLCAHTLSFPQAFPPPSEPQIGGSIDGPPAGLDTLANSLYCFSAALPKQLMYQGEFLTFANSTCTTLQSDGAKHSIHIMTQLSRFMINHYQVFDSTSRRLGSSNSRQPPQLTTLDQSAWNHYLAAASEIVALVRNCARRHIHFVNPFLASTIWLAAAAQVVSKSFGPDLVDSRVAESNLDLLRMNLDAFVSIWGVSTALQQKLTTLESKLKAFNSHTESPYPRGSEPTPAHQNLPGVPWPPLGGLPVSKVVETDYNSPIYQRTFEPQKGFASYGWPVQSGVDFSVPPLEPEMGIDLWGWGLDELMTYGGLEDFRFQTDPTQNYS